MSTSVAPSIPFGRKAKAGPVVRPLHMRLSTDSLRMSVMLLTIMTISRFHSHFPGLAAIRPGVIATAIVAIYAFLNPGLLARGNLFRTPPAKLMLAFLGVACLSVPFGISMGNSGLYMIDSYLKTIVFCMLVIMSIRNVKDLYSMAWAIVISAGILAYMAVFVFQLQSYDAYARLGNMYMYDGNDVACVLTACLGFVLLLTKTARPFGRLFSLAIFILAFAAIARTGSRGAMLGLIGAGVALLILAKGVSIPGRIVFVGVAFFALSAWAPRGYWDQMRTILKPTEDYNYTEVSGRKQVAERGIEYMKAHPVFGVGIDNFSKAECTLSHYAKTGLGRAVRCSAPHNSYLQAGAELGVGGLALWLTFIVGGIVGPIMLRRRMPRHWRKGDAEEQFLYQASVFLPVTFVAYAVTTFFLTFAFMDFTYFLIAFLAGLLVATNYKLGQNQLFPPPPSGSISATAERRSHRFYQIFAPTPVTRSDPVPTSE